MARACRVVFYLLVAMIAIPGIVNATIVYTYDFPGTPGSGLASNQSSTAPAYTTFGDWSRVNVTAGPTANAFESTNWNTTSTFDPTEYASFTITTNAGWHLNLQLLTFDEVRASGGPTKGRVDMFINGSTTAYATFNYNPSASVQNKSFDFTDTVDADNVTTVEFRFYGWNGGTAAAGLTFDNVAITLDVVPEVDCCGIIAGLFAAMVIGHSVFTRRLAG